MNNYLYRKPSSKKKGESGWLFRDFHFFGFCLKVDLPVGSVTVGLVARLAAPAQSGRDCSIHHYEIWTVFARFDYNLWHDTKWKKSLV